MMSTRTTGRLARAAAAMIGAAALVAGATAPARAADPRTDGPKAAKQQRYCVKPQATTGTILTRKTCMSREQWIAKTGIDPVANAKK